ncbi:MAG: AAA family ATPase [Planctomycetes bacterium]|nr:AAA family ATPase [Planctomycetota bacterium]
MSAVMAELTPAEGLSLLEHPDLASCAKHLLRIHLERRPAHAAALYVESHSNSRTHLPAWLLSTFPAGAPPSEFWQALSPDVARALFRELEAPGRAFVVAALPAPEAGSLLQGIPDTKERLVVLAGVPPERAAEILLSQPPEALNQALAILCRGDSGPSLADLAARIDPERLECLVRADRAGHVDWGRFLDALGWSSGVLRALAGGMDASRALALLARGPTGDRAASALRTIEAAYEPSWRDALHEAPTLAASLLARLPPSERLACLARWRPGGAVVQAIDPRALAEALETLKEEDAAWLEPWVATELPPTSRARVFLSLSPGRNDIFGRLLASWLAAEADAVGDEELMEIATPLALALLFVRNPGWPPQEQERIASRFPAVDIEESSGPRGWLLRLGKPGIELELGASRLPEPFRLQDVFRRETFVRELALALHPPEGPLFRALDDWVRTSPELSRRMGLALPACRAAYRASPDPVRCSSWIRSILDPQDAGPSGSWELWSAVAPHLDRLSTWDDLEETSARLREIAAKATARMDPGARPDALGRALGSLLAYATDRSSVTLILDAAHDALLADDPLGVTRLLADGFPPVAIAPLASLLPPARPCGRIARVALAAIAILPPSPFLPGRRAPSRPASNPPDPFVQVDPPPWVAGFRLSLVPFDCRAELWRICGRLLGSDDPLAGIILESFLVGGTLLLFGPPGHGKTTAVELLAALLFALTADEVAAGTLSCHPELTKDDLAVYLDLGALIREGKEVVRLRPIARSSFALLDDFNRASSEIQNYLLAFLDRRSAQLSGRTIRSAPDAVFATVNRDSDGAISLHQACRDRFDVGVLVGMPSPLVLDVARYGTMRPLKVESSIVEDEDRPVRPEVRARFDLLGRAREEIARVEIPQAIERRIRFLFALLIHCALAGLSSVRTKAQAHFASLARICLACSYRMAPGSGGTADKGEICSASPDTAPGRRAIHALFRYLRARAWRLANASGQVAIRNEDLEALVSSVLLHRLTPAPWLVEPGPQCVDLDRPGWIGGLWKRAIAKYEAYAQWIDGYFDVVAEVRSREGRSLSPALWKQVKALTQSISSLESVARFPMLADLERISKGLPPCSDLSFCD